MTLLVCDEFGLKPCTWSRLKPGRPSESRVGSGQAGTPSERMHRAYVRRAVIAACTNACGQSPVSSHGPSESLLSPPPDPPLSGYRCWQAVWAAWSWELLTPSSCALVFGTCPVPAGSGNFGTPCERMQWE